MDKIINYTNNFNTKNITFMYSTPSQFINALKQENKTWPVKTDDGYPYADDSTAFWTGFFSSRPSKKK